MPQCMIGLPMAYERLCTATRLATAALLVGGCGRIRFEDHTIDAELPCTPAVQIAAIDGGHDFYCAKLDDNTLRCWGANDTGQLGDGTRTTALGAGVSPDLPSIEQFSTGYQHTCAVRQGDVYCWGRNDIGQLGQPDRIARTVPTRVSGVPGDMVGVVAGGLSTCAWNVAGALYCWGQRTGTAVSPSNTPRLVTGIPPVRDVALSTSHLYFSADHGCAIGTDDTAWCWGDNALSQLGDGTTVDSDTPISVTTPPVVSIAAGNAHTCAVTNSGELYCWGLNVDGQAGEPPGRVTTPTRVAALSEVSDVDANGELTCVRLANGDTLCMGDNDNRQLGRDGDDAFVPERIVMPPAAQLAAGTDSACALGVDGILRCWGTERSGVISGAIASATTTTIADVQAIQAGGDNTCALTTDGRVLCWGAGSLGQLGTGVTLSPTADPTQIPLPRAATMISVGYEHMCAQLDDASVRCWGWNESNEVDPDSAWIRPVVAPPGIPASMGVMAGGGHSCSFTIANNPWCWGGNSEGALGLPNASTGMTPAQSNFTEVVAMAGGGSHSCAKTTGNSMLCAGRNNELQIGAGATGDVYTPFLVPLDLPVVSIAAGDTHTCAVTTGDVWCWGDSITGQIGLGVGVEGDVPAKLTPFGTGIVEIVAGRGHTCVRDVAAVVTCWGSNADGQLGTGTLETVASPVSSPELLGATQLAAGSRHTCGLMENGDIRCVGGNDMGQLGGSVPVASPTVRQSAFTCPR